MNETGRAMFSAPLLMSNDLRKLHKADRDLLLDPTLIAINQDALGIQGQLVACPGGCHRLQLWSRKLENDRRALAFLNVSPEGVQEGFCIPWKALGWPVDAKAQVVDVFNASSPAVGAVGIFCVESMQPTSIAMYVAHPQASFVPLTSL